MTEKMESAPEFSAQLLSPRWWPTWLVIGLVRLMVLLPIPFLTVFGEHLGRFVGRFAKSRERVVLTNLRLCFPDLSEEERVALLRAHWAALGRGVFEAALGWWASDQRLAPSIEIEGKEHLDAAVDSGKGLLLLTGHFSTLELGAKLVVQLGGIRFHAMYRPYKNAVMDYWMHQIRSKRAGLEALPRNDLRKMVRALRAGRAIWYAPDQTLDMRRSVFAPFFGVQTLSVAATGRLAQMGDALVLPYFPEKTSRGWRVRFYPVIENFPSGDELQDTIAVNAALEVGIRRAMAEYFWVHKRFKRRPEGELSPYD